MPGLCHFKALDQRNTNTISNVKKSEIRQLAEDFHVWITTSKAQLLISIPISIKMAFHIKLEY